MELYVGRVRTRSEDSGASRAMALLQVWDVDFGLKRDNAPRISGCSFNLQIQVFLWLFEHHQVGWATATMREDLPSDFRRSQRMKLVLSLKLLSRL